MSACPPQSGLAKTNDGDLSERARAIYRERRIQFWKSVMLFEANERQVLFEATRNLRRTQLGDTFPVPGPTIDDIMGRIRLQDATIQEMLEDAFFELGRLPTAGHLQVIVRLMNESPSAESQRALLEAVYRKWLANPTELYNKLSHPALDNDLATLRIRHENAENWLFTLRCKLGRLRRELVGKHLPIKVDLSCRENWEEWVNWEGGRKDEMPGSSMP